MINREEAVDTLKRYWKVDKFQFLAVLEKAKNLDGTFKNFGFFKLKKDDRNLSYPLTDGYNNKLAVSVFIPDARQLQDGKSYLVVAQIADEKDRIKQNNPFLLQLTELFDVEQNLNSVSPKDFIATWFGKKGENPGDAASIASQLKLNQLELYTQTKRFVFELIQNADDMPVKGKDVEINIRLLKDYFIFQHTGLYFDRENVKAISDAAQSTKKNDETKTGYKGIGFKSVFSDSEQVFIYSRDYSFKFDKTAPIYKDFKKLYEPYWSKLTTEARNQFFIDYRDQEGKYTNTDNIPWQIKPIWIDLKDYPTDLAPCIQTSKNVNIALGVGQAKIDEKRYDSMIRELVADPRFLLFLRHTKKIIYTDQNNIDTFIEVAKTENETRVFANNKLESVYSSYQDDILINNDAFTQGKFDLQHIEIEKGKWVFRNKEGKILENIPEKLGKLKETTLSFAVKQIEKGKIAPVSESESILYNYLPTSDYNYKFPFIVNADFVSKTDREGILAENIWNHYLFFHIGYSLVKWVNTLVDKGFISSALKVLPRILLDESNVDRHDINASFNRGLKKGIAEIAFLLSHDRKKVKCTESIYDSSGLASIIGPKAFQQFLRTDKELVNWRFDDQELNIPYLNIVCANKKLVLEKLSNPQSLQILNQSILALSSEKYVKFLEWLNQASFDYATLSKLEFLRFGTSYYSLLSINVEYSTLFIDDAIISSIPKSLLDNSALVSDLSYTDYPNLLSVIQKNTYLSVSAEYATKVVNVFSSKIFNLSITNRLSIIAALRKINSIDLKYVAKLQWFKNNLGELKSLQELYDPDGFVYSSNYNSLFISDSEYKLLSRELQKELKSFVSLLDDDSYKLNFRSSSLSTTDDIELRFLNKFIDLAQDDANIYKKLAQKIQINEYFIDGELWADELVLKYVDNVQKEQSHLFKLVQIHTDLQTKNNLLEELLKIIPHSENKIVEALRNEIFHLKEFPVSKIDFYLRTELKGNLNYDQVLFLVIRNWIIQKNIIDLKSSTISLTEADKVRLMDTIYSIGISHQSYSIRENGEDVKFIEKDKFAVIDNDILAPEEQLSPWLINWINRDPARLDFLVALGCFGTDNIHYKIRQALKNQQIAEVCDLISSISNHLALLHNTTNYIKTFAEKVFLDNTACVLLIIEYYNKLSSFNLTSNANFNYPTLDLINNRFVFKDLLSISKFYKYNNAISAEYYDKIISYVRDTGSVFIPDKLELPNKFLSRVKSIEIEKSVNEDVLKASSQLYNAEYYQAWSKKDRYPIYICEHEFIPFRSKFEDLILTENFYSEHLIYKVGSCYYVCRSEISEIPFNLNNIPSDDWKGLVEQSYFFKKSSDKKNDDSKTKYDLSEEEAEAFSKLFGYNLSKPDRGIWSALAIFKAIRFYEDKGYNLSSVVLDLEQVIKQTYFTITINGVSTRIYPRSARKNLLFVSIQLWNVMVQIPTIIYCLSKKGEPVIVEDVKSLIDQDKNVIFKISADNSDHRKEIIDSYFSGKNINDYQYNKAVSATMILRLNKDSEYNSVFDGMDY
ncbi:sacsin N-terminal ATP-binding-like domain-containing protein [Sphingobacterium sp. Lzh-3]|uniref:sacsin N-terminal ATP-binding-like domain-containing protein n=1 Tax=Sphingobacterium sp. Lzh-3 TaxID=3382150 RepID=UPI00398CADE3